ncbi:hypothetical protein DFH09DRAFT_1315326 [Mycena vulgaris]|nr:hypothetical protein DFH09DRAFT_1315326 [Mycena vulgaris]
MPYPFNFPWHQLTRLSTTFTSNTEALSTLRELSNVVECSLRYEDEDAIPENTTIIRLPHLRSLTIEWETVEDNPSQIRAEYSLLKYLETPHLGKLNTQNTADAAAVLALLMRSGCAESLTFFHFHLPSIPEHDSIIQLIQSMPRLVELQIGDLNGTLTEFFDVFSSQWRRAQERSGPPRPTLYAQLVDCMHPGDMSPELPLLREDGLFVEVSSVSNYRSVIMDCFN